MRTVLLFLILAFCAWITARNFWRAVRGDDLSIFPQVETEFRTLVVNNDLPQLCFKGRTAQVVDDRQEGIADSGSDTFRLVRVHRFARNAHGNTFSSFPKVLAGPSSNM